MSGTPLDFIGQVDDWTKATNARLTAVFRESTQRTVSLAQSMIPVDTGFARASIRASLSAMPQIELGSRGAAGSSYTPSGETVTTIAAAEIGDVIYVGWTANYVEFLEKGHSKQAPSGFVRLAVLQWQQTVSVVISDLKARQ